MTATNSPGRMQVDTDSSATWAPKRRPTRSSITTGEVGALISRTHPSGVVLQRDDRRVNLARH